MKGYSKLMLAAMTAGMLFHGCLVDNFWASKFSEILNRGIFGAINNALVAGDLQPI